MQKKWLAAAALLLCMAVLTGCRKAEAEETTVPSVPATEQAAFVEPPLLDKSGTETVPLVEKESSVQVEQAPAAAQKAEQPKTSTSQTTTPEENAPSQASPVPTAPPQTEATSPAPVPSETTPVPVETTPPETETPTVDPAPVPPETMPPAPEPAPPEAETPDPGTLDPGVGGLPLVPC